MTGSDSGSARKTLIVTGVIIAAVAVGAAFAVPPLLSGAEAAPATSVPTVPASPVISATPIPEPTRAPVDWDSLTEEEEAALFDGQGPRGTAMALVQETYPDDFAYGYMTDGGFGVGFKFGAPAEAIAVLDAVGDPYEMHENVGFTDTDIQPQVLRASALVGEAVPTGQTFSVTANPYTVTVEVELAAESADGDDYPELSKTALTALTDAIRPVLYPGFDVKISTGSGGIVTLAG